MEVSLKSFKPGKTIERVSKEIAVYTLERHLKKSTEKVQDIYYRLRDEILAMDSQIEENIKKQIKQVPHLKIITSIKGIKEITAAAIISEVADFKAFRGGKEVEKLAGLNLYEVSSGKHKGEKHISKRGRPLLRKVLFLATLNMVRKDGIFHQEYQNHRSKGMPGPKALTAISRKLLRTIYAMIRDNKCFDENFVKEKKNKLAA